MEAKDGRYEGKNPARPVSKQRDGAIAADDAQRILPNLSSELVHKQSGDDGVGVM